MREGTFSLPKTWQFYIAHTEDDVHIIHVCIIHERFSWFGGFITLAPPITAGYEWRPSTCFITLGEAGAVFVIIISCEMYSM